jgi:molecular chaperone DnaK
MIRDAEANADADQKQRELIEVRNQADAVVHKVQTDMKEVDGRLSEDQTKQIDEAIANLNKAIAETDKESITTKVSELLVAANIINELQQPQTTEEQPKPKADDDVIDAEFKETK